MCVSIEPKSSERERRKWGYTSTRSNSHSGGNRAGSLLLWSVRQNIFQTQFPRETQVWTFRWVQCHYTAISNFYKLLQHKIRYPIVFNSNIQLPLENIFCSWWKERNRLFRIGEMFQSNKFSSHEMNHKLRLFQGKGRTNAWSVPERSSTSIIWLNTNGCTVAKSPSSAPSASSASLTPAPIASTWIIVTLTASPTENRSTPPAHPRLARLPR